MRKNNRPARSDGGPAKLKNALTGRYEYLIVVLILLSASLMILPRLGDGYMWGDEAQTALISRTVLTHGLPLGFDGRNHFSTELQSEYGSHYIWRWHPWLPFYVLAGFFALFGQSTLICRLPFALFGIATVMLVYFFGKSVWGRRAGVMAAGLMMASVPMLLLFRQCRYYSMATFFCIAGLYSYQKMLDGRKHAGTAFAISAFLLFHSLHIYLAALLITVLIHSAVSHRNQFKRVFLLSAIVTVVNVPWIMFFSSVAQAHKVQADLLHRMLSTLAFFSAQTVVHLIPSWPVLLCLAAVLFIVFGSSRYRPDNPVNRDGLLLVILYTGVTIAVLLPTAAGEYIRYLAPVIPAACLLTALVLDLAMRLNPAIGLAVIAIFALQGRMSDYMYELTHDYYGPIEGISEYLNTYAAPTDVVAANHEPLPLMFYTDLKIISGVSGESFGLIDKADWIVYRQAVSNTEFSVAGYIDKVLKSGKYEEITVNAPDAFEQNRENPEDHNFRTADKIACVIIYRKIEQ